MTPDGEFREAVARLHRAKDAVYRDAWKRRGEVISILANIARKVDRLEYGLDGAPATAGESWLDTAVDLPVTEAAERVVSQFGELEACFHELTSTRPVPVRLDRLIALTDAAVALAGTFRREYAQTYAGLISSCLAMGEGGAADAR